MLTYKGYTGHVELDEEAGIFHGEVLDLRDVVTFQGKSVKEPDKPFSGKLMVRLPPELHRKVYTSSKEEGKSLNQWIAEKLSRAI